MSKQFYEHSLWKLMKNHCPDNIALDRVEAKMPLGLPDVQGCAKDGTGGIFQIELKAIDRWPLVNTRLGLRPEQMYYLNKKGNYKQKVFLFAKIEDDFILVHGKDVGELQRHQWFERASGIWYKQVDWKVFYNIIYL